MPEDPVALVERYYAGFNAGDVEAMTACLAENVRHDVNQGARRIGTDAFVAFNDYMAQRYSETLEDIVVMAGDDGSRAAAEFIVVGRYLATDEGMPPATGQVYRLPAGAFFEIADGKITRVTTYYNVKDFVSQVSAH